MWRSTIFERSFNAMSWILPSGAPPGPGAFRAGGRANSSLGSCALPAPHEQQGGPFAGAVGVRVAARERVLPRNAQPQRVPRRRVPQERGAGGEDHAAHRVLHLAVEIGLLPAVAEVGAPAHPEAAVGGDPRLSAPRAPEAPAVLARHGAERLAGAGIGE